MSYRQDACAGAPCQLRGNDLALFTAPHRAFREIEAARLIVALRAEEGL
jgi:hypothetical protein